MRAGVTIRNERARQRRLPLVEKYYTRSYTAAQIQEKVMQELNLKTYAYKTVLADIERIKKEWRDERIEDIDHMKRAMLKEVKAIKREMWEQYEKSKKEGLGDVRYMIETRHENEFVADLFEIKKQSVEVNFGGDWQLYLCNPETAKRTQALMKKHKVKDIDEE